MVEYYNLSKFSNNLGWINWVKTTSELTNQTFGLALLLLIFLLPTITLIKKGETPEQSIMYASFFTALMGIYFYVTQIVTYSLAIYLPALIFVICLGIIFYRAR